MDSSKQDNALCELNHLSVIEVSGADAKRFLQGQLSCDLNEINRTQGSLSCICNQKGRILATFYVLQTKDQYYLCLTKALIDDLLAHLTQYALFSQVTFTQSNDTVWGLIGSEMSALLQSHCNEFSDSNYHINYWDDCSLMTLSHSAKNIRYLCLKPNKSVFNTLQQHCKLADKSSWILRDIQAHVFMAQPETSTLFTPAAANFDQLGGVSVTKGCYLGQEIIARMHHLGQCKQTLASLTATLTTKPLPGDIITDDQGKMVGTITQTAKLDDEYLIQVVCNKTNAKDRLFFQQQSLRNYND